jgi:hypothetical protein
MNSGKASAMEKHGVVYQYTCMERECLSLNKTYIGHTTVTLAERLYQHRYHGSIFKHFREAHDSKPTKDILENNTKIIYQARNYNKESLSILEALHIYSLKPSINDNIYDFNCLKLFHRRAQQQEQFT